MGEVRQIQEEGDAEEEEDQNEAGRCRDGNACRRPRKRRKLLPSSSDVSTTKLVGSSSIQVSPPCDDSSSVSDRLQNAPPLSSSSIPCVNLPSRSQQTENSLSLFPHTYDELIDTAPSRHSQSIKHTRVRYPHCEGLSCTDRQIRSVIGLSFSHIQSLPGESEHTQINVFSRSHGTCFAQNPHPLHGHHLPHDLVISNIVASRLPLINLIRARTVCRAWRDSIFSPAMAMSFNGNPDCRRPRLLIEHSSSSGPGLAVFDPAVCGWSVVPAPSFGRLVAASSGLFCYVTEAGRPPSLVVGNPLSNQWKHLPAIPLSVPAHGPQIVGMVADNSESSYRVTILFGIWDDDASDAYLPFVYDSLTERWSRKSTVSARLSFASARSVVKAPDILLSVDSNAGSLLSYDMTKCTGHTTQLQRLPSSINEEDQKTNLWRRLPQLAVCKGELFLVARCVGEKPPGCKLGHFPIVQHSSVGIWMMQTMSADWQWITCIPLDLLEKMVEGSDGTDFIIASNSGSTLFFVLKGSPHMLAYDSIMYTWSVLPGCPADYNSYPLHQSAFFEPLLWMSAI